MTFTSKQREILKIAKDKGFVTLEDFNAAFSSPISRKSNIQRFLALGVLAVTNTDKFQPNSKKLEELENGK
jgi:seryl-tRNA(Sec) selenium transferase